MNKSVVTLNEDTYRKLSMIAGLMGQSVGQLLSSMIDTKEFQDTINRLYENMLNDELIKIIEDFTKKQVK